MNPWDFVTWVAAFALGISAAVIFAFFLRDARSILDREMHGHDEDPGDAETSDFSAAEARSESTDDQSV